MALFGVDVKVIPQWAWRSLSLFFRTKNYEALPLAGGLKDQLERTMQILDVLSGENSRWRQEQEEHMRKMNELKGRRGGRK